MTARRQQLSWNCGVEGPTTMPRSSRCASARSATSWRRCSSRRACRCCRGRRDRAARRAATTTPTARTTRSAWLDWDLSDEGEGLLEFTRPSASRSTRHRVLPRPLLPGRRPFPAPRFGGRRLASRHGAVAMIEGARRTPRRWKGFRLLSSGEAGLAPILQRLARREGDRRSVLLIVNASHEDVAQKLPADADGRALRDARSIPHAKEGSTAKTASATGGAEAWSTARPGVDPAHETRKARR